MRVGNIARSSGPRRNRSKLTARLLMKFLDGSQQYSSQRNDHPLLPVAQGQAGSWREPADSCSFGNEKWQVSCQRGGSPALRHAPSVIIRAAHVVAAFFTDQFAFARGQSRGADRTIEHRLLGSQLGLGRWFSW